MNCLRLCASLVLSLATCIAARAQSAGGPAVLPPPSMTQPQLVPAQGGTPSSTQPEVVTAPTTPTPFSDSPYNFDSLLPPPAAADSPESIQAGALDAKLADAITPTTEWHEPAHWFGFDPWDAGIELGINGSEGNNDVFSMRVGGHLKRETPRWKLDSSIVYNKNNANGVETQNNGKQDMRVDRILAESPWTVFVLENIIYDEFQAFDLQLSVNSGVGYQWINTERFDFLTRVGAGSTRDVGGPESDWQPQALFGLDYTQQLSKMQKLTAKVDYYPEWEDFRQYRVITDAGWEIALDQPKNLSIKISVIDRYDSTPDGAVPNNLDYAVLLIWGL